MNDNIPTLLTILERIAAGAYTDADLADLRRALLASGQGNVVQIGRYNVVIHNGQDIRIGDTIYQLPPPEPEIDLSAAEARYREQVAATYNRLGFSGFPETDLMLTKVPLDKVFVRLSLTVEKVVRAKEGEQGAGSKENGEMTPGDRWTQEGERSAREPPGQGQREQTDRTEREQIVRVQEPVTLAVALSKNVLIVGEPGAGKSTLLCWLAVTYALGRQREADMLGSEAEGDRLPVYVELGRLPDAYLRGEGGQTPNWKELLPELTAEQQAFEPTAGLAVARALAGGRCLVLCDGLDEVADRTARARIAGSLAEFGHLSAGNRVVVGSRPAGIADTESALQPGFQRCQIERFTPDEMQRFFRFWYGLDASLASDRQMADADALYSRVQADPGVANLAATPLLATILLLIWRNEGDLPARRVEVYERCCKILAENWERHHQVGHGGVLATLGWEAHLRLLAPVAYAIHSREQRTSATREELAPVLAKSLQEEGLCSGEQHARREADGFLAGLGLRSGLLQRLGPEEYGFSHLTFQEYLAARYIGDQEYPDYIDLFMAHLHEGWWREVHLLAMGYLGSDETGGKKGSRLILEILKRYPPSGRHLVPSRHALVRLVEPGRWLPGYQWQRRLAWLLGRELELVASGCGEMLPATITKEAAGHLKWLADRFVREGLFDATRQEIMSDLAPKLGRFSPEVLAMLIAAAHILPIAALSLGRLGQASCEARLALIRALGGSDSATRQAAAVSLGQLGQTSVEVIAALINALRDSDFAVWHAVVSSLARLGQTSNDVVPMLNHALHDDNSFHVRWGAASSLAWLSRASSEAEAVLLCALSDSDPEVREAVAYGCGWFGILPSPEIVLALERALRDDSRSVQEQAAFSLAKLGQASPAAMRALIDALANNDPGIRRAAVRGLGQSYQPASPEVVTPLIRGLADSDSGVREAAADSLGLLGQTSPEVVAELTNGLRDRDSHVRLASALGLVRLGQVPHGVAIALTSALSDSAPFVRQAAASSLGQLGQALPGVLATLDCALGDSDSGVREAAASSLSQLSQASPEAVSVLIRALYCDKSWVRQAVVSGLGQLDQVSPETMVALTDRLHDNDSAVRWAAASSIGKLGQASSKTMVALIDCLHDSDSAVRRTAASSIGKLGQASNEAIVELINALNDRDTFVQDAAVESLGMIGKLNESQLETVLRQFNRHSHGFDIDGDLTRSTTVMQAAQRLLAGRPLPGQQWMPIRERQARRRTRLRVSIVVAAVAALLLAAALWALAQQWLGAGSRIAIFVAAAAAVVALPAAVTEILGYLRRRTSPR